MQTRTTTESVCSCVESPERLRVPARRRSSSLLAAIALVASIAGACGPDDPPATEVVFPAGYEATYVEVRNCRRSPDHDLSYIRVLANAEAEPSYRTLSGTLPEGSVLVKEEFADEACTELTGWTAMRKEPAGYAPEGGDWRWQRVDLDRTVVVDGAAAQCLACHQFCTPDFGCAVP